MTGGTARNRAGGPTRDTAARGKGPRASRRRPPVRRDAGARGVVAIGGALLLALGGSGPAAAQAQTDEPRVSATWRGSPIHEVMLTLADVSGRSIVLGAGVSGFVTATITDQPWDAVLEAVAFAHGLVVAEGESGILRLEPVEGRRGREAEEELVTRAYRINYVPAVELQATLAAVLSERGTIGIAASTNTLVVSDVPRVQAAIAGLLGRPGVSTPDPR